MDPSSAAAANGARYQNTARQSQASINQPPTTGPRAMEPANIIA